MPLQELADAYWSAFSEAVPTVATVRGVHDFDEMLPRWDDHWRGDMAARFRDIRDRSRALAESDLSIQERITRSLLIHQAEAEIDTLETPYLRAPIDPFLGPHTRLISDTRQNTVADTEQATALLGRYEKVPEYLEGAMLAHRENVDHGMAPAAASVTRVLSQLNGYLGSSLEDDPFLLLAIPGGRRETWLEKATILVTEKIRPAMETYRVGMTTFIAPRARDDDHCGLAWIDGGEEIYGRMIAKYLQMEAPAQEMHDIGLEWATGINASEWVDIGGEAFGAGDIDSVFEMLETDPALRFDTEAEMLDHARRALERAWAVVDDWFAHRPETPCEVVPVPAAVAPAMPAAYYSMPPVDGSRPGRYFLNTYRPAERDLFEYESIHFHEGIPGHHFDRSLAAELEGIPTFRRYAQSYAHTEGWGLYSERLADEMGLYSAPTDRLGMVAGDAWRAGRLVTDTGIHALGWSRQQAIDFLQKWTPIGPLTVEQEIDRYIGMPGQALSYKMGQLEILRLRDDARRRMGDRFEIKGFHDTMLVNGGMPLPMLAVAVEEWVAGLGP